MLAQIVRRLRMGLGVVLAPFLVLACDGGTAVFGNGSCEVGDRVVADGETFAAGDGCNSCTCEDGDVLCTLAECVQGCDIGGVMRAPGETWNDGCNDCWCGEDGQVACTDAYCGPFDCTYLGETQPSGSSFPARDGCNTCTCDYEGFVSCTEMACACDAESEWWREYVGESPSACAVIDFDCPEHTTLFENACGCGCEQDIMCAEQYDCQQMSCNVDDLRATCPYSEILE